MQLRTYHSFWYPRLLTICVLHSKITIFKTDTLDQLCKNPLYITILAHFKSPVRFMASSDYIWLFYHDMKQSRNKIFNISAKIKIIKHNEYVTASKQFTIILRQSKYKTVRTSISSRMNIFSLTTSPIINKSSCICSACYFLWLQCCFCAGHSSPGCWRGGCSWLCWRWWWRY